VLVRDAFTLGIPILAILFGVLWNQQALRDLKTEFKGELQSFRSEVLGRFNAADGRFNAIDGRLDRMQADLSQFYQTLGDHGARIDHLEKKRSA
jgi:hypothetical protein